MHPRKPPFLITGSGRCGTTLVRRLLVERAKVIIPPENYVLYKTPTILVEFQNWDEVVDRIVSLLSQQGNWSGFNIDREHLENRLRQIPENARSGAAIWNTFHDVWAECNDLPYRDHWGDKTPRAALQLKGVRATLPNVRFVFLVRNPYDVIRSYLEMDDNEAPVAEIGARWRKANLNILKMTRRAPKRCLIVKYEQLVADESGTIGEIMEHIRAEPGGDAANLRCLSDVPSVPHFQNVTKPVFTSSVGRGIQKLSKEELDVINPIIEDVRTALGYE